MDLTRLILSGLLLVSISNLADAAAFGNPDGSGGTVYALGSDIINGSDSNDFKELYIPEYTDSDWRAKYPSVLKNNSSPNIQIRRYYEIKEKKWLSAKFYIFEASYEFGPKIEVQVSHDNGKRPWQEAFLVGSIYAEQLGYIPPDLRKATHTITIHNHYNGLMAGNNNIIIFEKRGAEHIDKGSIEEALFHEATHNYFNTMLFKKEDPFYGLWKQAQSKDNDYISYYAKTNDFEDIAESFIAYYAVKYKTERAGNLKDKVLTAIPNRVLFFEGINLNLTHLPTPLNSIHKPWQAYQIISSEDQRAIDITNDGLLTLKPASTDKSQLWQLISKADSQYGSSNRYHIRSMQSNDYKCIDVINGGRDDQSLHLTKCGNYSGQLFSLKPVDPQQYQLMPLWQKNLTKNLADHTPTLNCMSVIDNKRLKRLKITPCDDSLEQFFVLRPY